LDEEVRHVKGIKSTDTRLVLMKMTKELPARNRNKQKPLRVSTT
jgi:hypothetical protein